VYVGVQTFLVSNLGYEYESGRLAVLDMLRRVAARLPDELLAAYFDLLWLPLVRAFALYVPVPHHTHFVVAQWRGLLSHTLQQTICTPCELETWAHLVHCLCLLLCPAKAQRSMLDPDLLSSVLAAGGAACFGRGGVVPEAGSGSPTCPSWAGCAAAAGSRGGSGSWLGRRRRPASPPRRFTFYKSRWVHCLLALTILLCLGFEIEV
jgi:hypothetical protein